MIDDGILFDYSSDPAYAASVQRIRDRTSVNIGACRVLTDRRTRQMRRFAVAIFDETGAADIDVCLMGNTLYILAVRFAERKWFTTANQPVEFGGCESSLFAPFPFEGGYGTLGIIDNHGLGNFTRGQASAHVAAMKAYMLAFAGGQPSGPQTTACKTAFAFFAMTIAEAARFNSVETMMYNGGIPPAATIPLLQNWVIGSSVCDAQFPAHIAIAGVHEQRKGKVWKDLVANLARTPALAPSFADLAGTSAATMAFLYKTGIFANADKPQPGSRKPGYESGYEFLLDAYFRDRVVPGLLAQARAAFDALAKINKQVAPSSYGGLTIA